MQPTERYKNGLMHKQVLFCEAYITNSQNAAKAAIIAGYGNGNPKLASHIAWGLLRGQTRTAKLIQKYINKRLKSVSRKMQVGYEEKRNKLWHIAKTCAPDDVPEIKAPDGTKITKMPDPKTAVSAIAEMNKMDGDIAAEKRELAVDVQGDIHIQAVMELQKRLLEENKREY